MPHDQLFFRVEYFICVFWSHQKLHVQVVFFSYFSYFFIFLIFLGFKSLADLEVSIEAVSTFFSSLAAAEMETDRNALTFDTKWTPVKRFACHERLNA